MNNELQKGLQNVGGAILKNSPYILTGLGCAGVLTTALFTGRATLKAYELIKMEGEELSTPEVIKLTWKEFIPPILMGVASIACILGANSINANRNAALAALYSLSETAFREYKEKVVEQIGRNKEIQVRDSIAKDRIDKNPVGDRTVIVTGNGDVLCYDKLSDRYFKSSVEKIRQQILEFSCTLLSDGWLDLNDLYYTIGLGSTELGKKVGFDSNKTIRGMIEVEFSTQIASNGEPCIVINPTVYPDPSWYS